MPKSKRKKKIVVVSLTPDWKPVRKGEAYCSPACGGRCTKASFDQAVRGAKRLVKALGKEHWQAAVWENLGWHFRATAGPLVVHGDYRGPKKSGRFTCSMLGRNPDSFMSSDPNKAVKYTVSHCIAGACKGLDALFAACEASNMKPELFRVFSQSPAIEFLRYPGGRTIEGAARFALGKDQNYDVKIGVAFAGKKKSK